MPAFLIAILLRARAEASVVSSAGPSRWLSTPQLSPRSRPANLARNFAILGSITTRQ
jgi:hypothetical protein